MPDIDIDFDMNRRGEVIEYVRQKYGNDQVAQIITFNTMAAKAAIKDVGRALDMPYGEVDRIAKLIPPTIGITIEKALEENPLLATAYRRSKDQRTHRHRAPPRRPRARSRCPRRRRRHRAPTTHRARPRHPHQRRSHRHQLRHEGRRKDGPAEDGLPRPHHPHRHRRLPQAHQVQSRRGSSTSPPSISKTPPPSSASSIAPSPPASSSLNPAACATSSAATSPTPSSTSPRSTPSTAPAPCP